ncbi:DUF397 domain-containing protein (plasmid) [Streptosporangium sp. CA-135522]|uniref:DUF397 domain-containing protein n=1 Tax=Streptosporangium sp. CA-135522 TaxID=3240072 RepID=UPI003D8C03D4
MREDLDLSRAEWRTSSFSGSNGQCVQVAFLGEHVAVRDSKDAEGPVLVFTPGEWKAFAGGVRLGEFEIPAS